MDKSTVMEFTRTRMKGSKENVNQANEKGTEF